MAIVHGFGQSVGDAGSDPDHGRFLDAELHGDSIGGLEPDPTDVASQPVWVLGHYLNGIGSVGFVDAHRPCRADAVAVQEDHDLSNDLLLGPGIRNAFGTEYPNAGDLA